MGASVHFWGRDNVLNAYKALDVAAWTLWQGSQMLPFKYEGEDTGEGAAALLRIFNSMTESTNALYTLKVYEEIPKSGKINKSTPDSGSFNFRLNLELQGLNQQQAQSVATRTDLESKIAALESRIEEYENELDAEPETPGPDMWERINGLLEKPAVVAGINKIFGLNLEPRAATIGNIPVSEDKLQEAIAILRTHDERLVEHLWKLALMAQEKPNNFKFLLSTLDSLQ